MQILDYDILLGTLAMTRSLGDAKYKNRDLPCAKQIVTAVPDVVTYKVTSEDEFIVLASDGKYLSVSLTAGLTFLGIWDCVKLQELIDIIRYHISLGATLSQTCAFICDLCIAPKFWQPSLDQVNHRGADNITIIIVALLQGQTKARWMEWISERVRMQTGYSTLSTVVELYPGHPTLHPPVQTDYNFTLLLPREQRPRPWSPTRFYKAVYK